MPPTANSHDGIALAHRFAYLRGRQSREDTGGGGRWVVVWTWRTLCAVLGVVWVAFGASAERDGVAQAAVPRGKADVFTSPANLSGLSGAPGTTFTLGVVVEPSGIGVDAASVAA